MAQRSPVDIGAMPNAGTSKDGLVVFFDFQGNDGNYYPFKVSYEALPTIVETLIRCADAAERQRGGRPPIKPGELVRAAPALRPTSLISSVSQDGTEAVLIFEAPGRARLSLQLSKELCIQLAGIAQQLDSKLGAPSSGMTN